MQTEYLFSVRETGCGGFGGESLSPDVVAQPPSDFDGRREEGLETNGMEAGEPDETSVLFVFEGPQTISLSVDFGPDALIEIPGLSVIERVREKFHDPRISVHAGERAQVVFAPVAQNQTGCFEKNVHGRVPLSGIFCAKVAKKRISDIDRQIRGI